MDNIINVFFKHSGRLFYAEMEDVKERDWFIVNKLFSKYIEKEAEDSESELFIILERIKEILNNNSVKIFLTEGDLKINDKGNKHLNKMNNTKEDKDYNILLNEDSKTDILILPFLNKNYLDKTLKYYLLELKYFDKDYTVWVNLLFYLKIRVEALRESLIKK